MRTLVAIVVAFAVAFAGLASLSWYETREDLAALRADVDDLRDETVSVAEFVEVERAQNKVMKSTIQNQADLLDLLEGSTPDVSRSLTGLRP